MKKTLSFRPDKIWNYLYPLYAREFLFGDDYVQFANIIAIDFDLTPAQWEAILEEWEIKELILKP